jgi:hypothetical protein
LERKGNEGKTIEKDLNANKSDKENMTKKLIKMTKINENVYFCLYI